MFDIVKVSHVVVLSQVWMMAVPTVFDPLCVNDPSVFATTLSAVWPSSGVVFRLRLAVGF